MGPDKHTHTGHGVYRLCAGLGLLECDPCFIKDVFWLGQSVVQDDVKGAFLPNFLNHSMFQSRQRNLKTPSSEGRWSFLNKVNVRKLDK